MPSIEIETVEALEAHLENGLPMGNVVVQGLDLTDLAASLDDLDLAGTVFLGTQLAQSTYERACAAGAVIFRPPLETPFSPYRSTLYTPEELFGAFEPADPESFADTLDERVYRYTRDPEVRSDILHSLACRLHDHAITDALDERIEGHDIVAIMGGHALDRTSAEYRDVAMIAKQLAEAGFLMTSGGGPGAMEATHFGAWMAHRPETDVDAALSVLGTCPGFSPRERWLATALEVKNVYPRVAGPRGDAVDSLGIPTWLYGHEPPTVFATSIAKYFANSVREEGLLAIANSGVVYAPGSAGTIQEVFQDAAQNHYRSFGHPSPMIFLGVEYWRFHKPVYPLLTQLAAGHDYAALLHITDDPAEVVARLLGFAAERSADINERRD
jgi:predicted Rossmann-fold nucleotide-binding protein